MSKGKRLRAERARLAAERANDPDQLVGALFEHESLADLEEFISNHPQILDPPFLDYAAERLEVPGFGVLLEAKLDMLAAIADGDEPAKAWSDWEDRFADLSVQMEALDRFRDPIEAAIQEERHEDALSLIEQALPEARQSGAGVTLGYLSGQWTKVALSHQSGNRSDQLEEAIRHGELAVELSVDPGLAADYLMTLALVYIERLEGDPRVNRELALGLLDQAMTASRQVADGRDLGAFIQHNISNALHRREEGDRLDNVTAAEQVSREALSWRNPQRNVVDWAFSQVTLGAILESRAVLGDGDIENAIAAHEAVIAEKSRDLPDHLMSRAHLGIGGLLMREADALENLNHRDQVDRDGDDFDGELLTAADEKRIRNYRARAEPHLRGALKLLDPGERPIDYARVAADLIRVLPEEDPEGDEIAKLALSGVRPDNDPELCRRLAFRVAMGQVAAGQLAEAEGTFRQALAADELLFNVRLETADRNQELKRAGNLARWTSYVLAVNGNGEAAVQVLEASRARELRRRLSLAATDALPTELADALEATRAALRKSSLGDDSADAARAFQEVLSEIRDLPGFERFGMAPSWEDVCAAVTVDWPVVYVNPTPWGILLLKLSRTSSGIEVETIVNENLVALELYVGLMSQNPEDAANSPSYLGAIGAWGENRIEDALGYLLPWVGEEISQSIAGITVGAEGVSIIPCGPSGLLPLHAATWGAGRGSVCLLDSLAVRFAPSASILAGCLAHAANQEARMKPLALGNPTSQQPLPAAEVEAALIVELLGGGVVAVGTDATSEVLRTADEDTTHLHLATHAGGSLVDLAEAGIILSDGWLKGPDLGTVLSFEPRLAVISACQSAMASIGGVLEESLSIASAFLAAGSACVIATLWPVNDLTTALLMTRLYEELAAGPAVDPPTALSRAQIWMRELTSDALAEFLARYPALDEELKRRDERDDHGLRMPGGAPPVPDFGPQHWAGFVAFGA